MTNITKLTRGAFLVLALVLAAPLGRHAVRVSCGPGAGAASGRFGAVAGNNGFSDAQLIDMVNVADRGSFTEGSLAADAESIRLAYLAKGYMGVTVTPRLEQVENGRTRITFVVNEGERTGIAAVNFTGNNSISAGTLKSIIRTHETHLLSWLFRDDADSEDQLQIDRQLIEIYYMNHGFPDAQVTSAVGEFAHFAQRLFRQLHSGRRRALPVWHDWR